jgi:hypothetical protein
MEIEENGHISKYQLHGENGKACHLSRKNSVIKKNIFLFIIAGL